MQQFIKGHPSLTFNSDTYLPTYHNLMNQTAPQSKFIHQYYLASYDLSNYDSSLFSKHIQFGTAVVSC